MQKLLIADCNETFRLALAELLRQHFQVLCCQTGTEALELLRKETPDILVLELMLPELDGLTLLDRAMQAGVRPRVLAFSALLSDYIIDAAPRLGISYIMRKPCELQAVSQRVMDLANVSAVSVRRQDLPCPVSDLLISLGIPTNHKGFTYLREAILLFAKDPAQSVTKELYPAVAKRCGCKKGHVERSVRSTLEASWLQQNPQLWRQLFPNAEKRPTNAQFISRLATQLGLSQE